MKTNFKYFVIVCIFLIPMLISCEDDFLERKPMDAITDASFWKSSNDLKSFANGFYRIFPRYIGDNVPGFNGGVGGHNGNLDLASDIQASGNPNAALMQLQNSGQAPVSDNNWNNGYNWIRQINYFLENSVKVLPRVEAVNQYTGEAYFFRAWVYFGLLQRFGGVPYITKTLNVGSEVELYKTRDSRYDVAKWIIQDLDSAITKLNWKGTGSATEAGRVTKEAAIVMKSRVALYEGTWERYHSGDEFGVQGKNGIEFLQLIEPSILPLISRQGQKIFIQGGPLNEPYNQLLSQLDASKTDGVYLYRVYDNTLIGGHSFYEKILNANGYTDNLVNSYLDKDGNPRQISTLPIDDKSLYSLARNLDPRFKQTIWTPDKGPMSKLVSTLTDGTGIYPSRYPSISTTQGQHPVNTGYNNWKGAILNKNELRNGGTDDVLVRYEEGLLNLAEAKAILGTLTQADIDKTVNLIRSRVNMASMLLSNVNSWPKSVYPSNLGFDQTEANIVNEIRRERLIELVAEGFRPHDLKRWAVFEKVINGYKPKGAHIDQFLKYYNNVDSLLKDGYTAAAAAKLKLTVGTAGKLDVDANGYLNPYYLIPEFKAGGVGYYVNPKRDYLSPIPKGQIDLYKEKAGVILQQNPSWF
jgi:hypothetical protein